MDRAGDPRLRIGDLAPDLRMLPPSDLYIVDDRDDGGTIRLTFTSVVWNAGDGPMEIRGTPDASEVLRVRQLVHRRSGPPRDARVSADEVYDDGCDAGVQGISPGWGDRYVSQLDEQDLVIGGVPDGRYRLVNIANPQGVLAEARLDNNVGSVDIVLAGSSVSVVGWAGDQRE